MTALSDYNSITYAITHAYTNTLLQRTLLLLLVRTNTYRWQLICYLLQMYIGQLIAGLTYPLDRVILSLLPAWHCPERISQQFQWITFRFRLSLPELLFSEVTPSLDKVEEAVFEVQNFVPLVPHLLSISSVLRVQIRNT